MLTMVKILFIPFLSGLLCITRLVLSCDMCTYTFLWSSYRRLHSFSSSSGIEQALVPNILSHLHNVELFQTSGVGPSPDSDLLRFLDNMITVSSSQV